MVNFVKGNVKIETNNLFQYLYVFTSFFSINSGLLFDVVCYDDGLEGSSGDISLSRRIYAHRAIPEVLVQEIKITNPTGSDQVFQLERQGITNWPSASSSERTIEHGDGKNLV